MTQKDFAHKSGYVTIFGLPNTGKSTLLNALLDVRLAIISARPQTTRRNVLGILNEEKMQCIFTDTPGIVKPKYELHKKMVQQVETALADADFIRKNRRVHTRTSGRVQKSNRKQFPYECRLCGAWHLSTTKR